MDGHYLLYNLKAGLRRITGRSVNNDDFSWADYTDHYLSEMSRVIKKYTISLAPGDYIFDKGKLKINEHRDILPLHPNFRLVYETILQLSPSSVLEVGCGGGFHLHNLSVLNPEIRLYGADISSRQIELLHKHHKNLKADVKLLDFTLPRPDGSPYVDLVYTQAVLMHLKTDNNHLMALENIFRCAKNQVILMENWTAHNFLDDIRNLYDDKTIPWDTIYFYYRISEEFNKPHLMVISREPLDYPVLDDYDILFKGV